MTVSQEKSLAVGVVIPARDEEQSIVSCLEAVSAALERAWHRLAGSWVVVAADSCTDATADLARLTLANRGSVIECSVGSAGLARRLGAADILERFHGVPSSQVWIANTDADTCVTHDWIERQLDLAESGYCACGGYRGTHRCGKRAMRSTGIRRMPVNKRSGEP